MNKVLIILMAVVAFIILGVSFNDLRQHTNARDKNANENMDERVGVVEETPAPDLLPLLDSAQNYEKAISYKQGTEITAYIQEVFGESADWAIRLCRCESGCNPDAVSSTGKYIGLYQYSHTTFDSNCEGSIYEWRDQVVCTKKLIDRGEYGRWPNCPK